jgi:hypothetical protein
MAVSREALMGASVEDSLPLSMAESAERPRAASDGTPTSRLSDDGPLQMPVDAWTLASQEDGDKCRADLESAGYRFRAMPAKKAPDKSGCGIPNAVIVWRGPTGIAYSPPIDVDCSMARALGSFETIVQEAAEAHLHSRITKIGDLGGFACRPRNSRKEASLSAHAFGAALDVASFQPERGPVVVIARDYAEASRASPAREGRREFLRTVYARLRNHEADLTYVVGPDFNASHRNHFHLDRGGWAFWFHR